MDNLFTVVIKAHRFYIFLIPPAVAEVYIEICDVHAGFANAVPKLHKKIIVACSESDIVIQKSARVVGLGVSYLAVVKAFDDGVSVDYRFRYQVVAARCFCVDFIVVPASAPALGNSEIEGFAAEVHIHEIRMLLFACQLRRAAGDSGSGFGCRGCRAGTFA